MSAYLVSSSISLKKSIVDDTFPIAGSSDDKP